MIKISSLEVFSHVLQFLVDTMIIAMVNFSFIKLIGKWYIINLFLGKFEEFKLLCKVRLIEIQIEVISNKVVNSIVQNIPPKICSSKNFKVRKK